MKNLIFIFVLTLCACTKERYRDLEGDYSGTCSYTSYENGLYYSETTQETYRVNFKGNKLYIGDLYEKLVQDGDYHFYSEDRKTSAHFNGDKLSTSSNPSPSAAGDRYCALIKQ